MATAARNDKYAYAPSRVYSYSRAAVAEELPEYEPEAAPQQPEPQRKTHPVTRTRIKREPTPALRRKQRLMPKILSVATVFAAAAVLIYIVVRYSAITAEWANVNALEAQIEESERRITELEVQLDEAINLDEARDTALNAGLDYPTADQIVDVAGGE